jgi:Protein of unknown function (DUF2867)
VLALTVRAAPEEYLSLELRAHELLRHVPLYDVSVVDLPGGGDGRSLTDVLHLHATTPRSSVERALYGVRLALGRAFGWDDVRLSPEDSLVSRLSETDRRNSETTPGTRDGAFRTVYRFRNEQLSETRNATVHGYVCIALAPRSSGYRFYFAVYVIPVSWLTGPYLVLIEPFRRFLLYPAMLRRIRNAWQVAYGAGTN